MPTRRGAAASATPGTLTGQISMSDVLLQALGDEASMDAAQFSQRVGDLFKARAVASLNLIATPARGFHCHLP